MRLLDIQEYTYLVQLYALSCKVQAYLLYIHFRHRDSGLLKYLSGASALEEVDMEGAGRFARYSKCESSIQEANCECQGVSKNSMSKSIVTYANANTFS